MQPSGSCGNEVSSGSKGEDMISKLPSRHILSFLSIKEAVLTSVLSKMWTFLSKLHFNDYTKNSCRNEASSGSKGEDMISKLPSRHILSFLSIKEAVLTSVLSKTWTFLTKLHFNDYTKNSCRNEASSDSKGEDMISKLPDFIIGYILSFLSTKEAVLTSVLSKRWKYAWTFLTKLHFNDYTKNSSTGLSNSNKLNSFPNFVSRVLFHLDRATIQEFSLRVSENYDTHYINQWISFVLNRRVKKLNVSLCDRNKSNLSAFPLFECQSLEELAFIMDSSASSCTIKVPSFVSLSSLTVLTLFGRITFTSYSSNEIFEELTLNFPLLRTYEANHCIFSGVKSITIEAPRLELVFIFNVQSRNIIRFSASRITNFTYYGDIISHTVLLDHQNIPSKIILFLNHSKDYGVEQISIFIRKLLSFFINAEYLQLKLAFCWEGHPRVEHYLAGIPAFRMLGYLELKLVTSNALLDFLLKSPCLKTLVLQMVDYDEESQTFTTVPDCFVSTLKVVKFGNYFGGEREFSFAKFVMENAKVLERISFSFPYQLYYLEAEKAKEKLCLLEVISCSTVIMEFSS